MLFRSRLLLGQLEAIRKFLDRFALVARFLNDLNDFVDIRKSKHQSFDDVRALFRLVEVVTRSAGDDFLLMFKVIFENFAKIQNLRFGAVLDKRKQNNTVRNLQIRMLIKRVENDLRVRVLLTLDNDPQSLSARFLADIRNSL